MYLRVLFAFIIFFSFHNLPFANAQNADLMQRDLSNVRADQISDEQIRRYIKYADARNLTDQQIEAAALARNMPSIELDKLMNRIRRIRLEGGRTQQQNRSQELPLTDSLEQQTQTQRDTALESELTEEEKKVFGAELFNSENLTFEPSLDMATPKNYQVGPGDELLINIWGASRQTYTLEVNREGAVVIDNLGPVYVNGLTIEEASQRIINRLTEIYSGLRASPERPANTFAEVTLGQVRSIKVTIVGEVRKPGTYTLSSLATAFNALYLSGGPTFIGSFRNIEIVRDNQIVAELDVYNFLAGGKKKTQNINLRDQDIIRVVPYESRIELKGEIKRPGYYEVKQEESLADAIRFGGGFTDKAYTHRLKITRKTSRAKRIEDVEEKELDTFMLKNGDIVQVDSILDRFENRVEIYGAVFRPGEYALTDTMTLTKLIKKAEGLREDAFVKRVLVYREDENLSTEVLSADLQSINKGTTADVPLEREDIVRVLSVKELEEEYTVEISGEVQWPGKFPFMYDMTLEDLIAIAGGMNESASRAKVEVARRIKRTEEDSSSTDREGKLLKTTEIYQFRVNEDLAIDPATAHFTLQPFDQVFVRRSPGYEEQQTVYIKGEVTYPGEYAIENKNERISNLISRAGGLTTYAYSEGANLIRLNPAYFEEKAIREEALRDSLRMLQYQKYFLDTNMQQQNLSVDSFNNQSKLPVRQNLIIEEISLPKYKISESITQSIGIELQEILSQPGSRYDIRLLPGDTLEIPKELQTVRMSGELLYPVSSRYDRRKNFRNYISEAGGFTKEADKKRSYIIYANGSVDRTHRFLFIKNYPEVKPGAEIVVPEKPNKQGISPQAWVGISSGLATITLTIVTILNRLQ